MALTDKYLVRERKHLDGVQRLYDVGRYGLSLVNAPILHHYAFAWEAAVTRDGELVYDTPLTDDVEVFQNDEEANAFIERAFEYFREGE